MNIGKPRVVGDVRHCNSSCKLPYQLDEVWVSVLTEMLCVDVIKLILSLHVVSADSALVNQLLG